MGDGNGKEIREAVEEELSRDALVDAAGTTIRNIDGMRRHGQPTGTGRSSLPGITTHY